MSAWTVVTEHLGGTSRVPAESPEEAATLYGATVEAWALDDRFTSAHIEGPDGQRFVPTVVRHGFGVTDYNLPLVALGSP